MKTAIDSSRVKPGIVGIVLLLAIVAGFSASSSASKRRSSGLLDDGLTQALHDSLMSARTEDDTNGNWIPDSLEHSPFNQYAVVMRAAARREKHQPPDLRALVVAPRVASPGALISIYVWGTGIADTVSILGRCGQEIASDLAVDRAGGHQWASWKVPDTALGRATVVVRTPHARYQAKLRITPSRPSAR